MAKQGREGLPREKVTASDQDGVCLIKGSAGGQDGGAQRARRKVAGMKPEVNCLRPPSCTLC